MFRVQMANKEIGLFDEALDVQISESTQGIRVLADTSCSIHDLLLTLLIQGVRIHSTNGQYARLQPRDSCGIRMIEDNYSTEEQLITVMSVGQLQLNM